MIISKLYIKNFLSYGSGGIHIDFDEHSLICLSGQNGHGKSALLDAITWSVWGFARKTMGAAKNDESLIRIGSNYMEVCINFFVNNILYQIHRKAHIQYKKCSSELFFVSLDSKDNSTISNLTESTQKDTQHVINQIIGFDYETFINSAYFKQGQSNEFSKKTAHERKDILCKLMKLDYLEEIRELILLDLRASNQELTLLDLRIADYTREKTQYTDLAIKKESFVAKKELYSKTKLYVEKEKKMHQEYLELHQKITQIKILEDQLLQKKKIESSIEENLKTYETLFFEHKNLDQIINTNKNRQEIIKSYLQAQSIKEAQLQQKIKEKHHILNEINNNITNCFACKTPLNQNQKNKLIQELHLFLKESEDILNHILNNKNKADHLQHKIHSILNNLEKKKEYKNSIQILYNKSSEEYHQINKQIEQITQVITSEKKNLSHIEFNIDPLHFKNLEQKEKELIILYEELAEEYAILKHAYERVQTLNEEILKLQDEKKRKQEDLICKEDLSFILGKDALQASILESLIPVLEFEANKILSKLTNSDYTLYVESTKDLKSGKTKETLEIIIEDSCGKRPYECFSGGEAFRIDLSLRLAITRLIGIYTNRKLETLIIDEGFGSQDGTGLEYIIDCLHVLQEEFKKIIVVSHLPSMKDLFPIHLHVYKTSNGSTVQYI